MSLSSIHFNIFLLLASLRYDFFFETLKVCHPRVTSWLLMTVTGVLQVLFIKLPVSLSVLLKARWHCSLKGVVYTFVKYFQFLSNFSHGIASILQINNTLMIFWRKLFLFDQFETIIKPTRCRYSKYPGSPKSQFYCFLKQHIFSCANIIAQGFSNDELIY